MANIWIARHGFIVLAIAGLGGLVALGLDEDLYLLFHSLVELFSAVVGIAIFLIVWNARRFIGNAYFIFLAAGYLFVSMLDLLHMLAYKGMGVFAQPGADLATQLWIVGRYMEAGTLLLAPLLARRRVRYNWLLAGYAAVTAVLLLSIFRWRVFPVCYVEGAGLTIFKIASEYVIMAILAASVVALLLRRNDVDRRLVVLVSAAVVVTILSEFAFTLYKGVYGEWNLLGHLLKLVSFYLIYKALIERGLRHPYQVMFRDLNRSQRELRQARDDLELRVNQRTIDLRTTVEELETEVRERIEAEQSSRQQKELLQTIIDSVPVMLVFFDKQGRVELVNRKFVELLGWSAEEFRDPRTLAVCYPDPEYRREVQEFTVSTASDWKDITMRARDGRVLATYWGQVQLAEGSHVSIGLDVSERKAAEQAAVAERQRLFSVLNQIPGFVALKTRQGHIRFANQAFIDVFGQPDGRPCYEVQHRRNQRCRPCPAQGIFDDGKPREWDSATPQGRVYHALGYPFVDEDGETMVLELGIDVTVRRELERQVIETSESEQRRIGRDLHDTLGQNLTGLAFLVKGLARKLAGGRNAQEVVEAKQLVDLVNESVAQVRSLARGLNPVGLEKGGLMAGLGEMVANVDEMFGVRCSFHCDEPVNLADQFVATHLYHIAQEALNNAMRHSQARAVEIHLDRLAGAVRLSVSDDGLGIKETDDQRKGMGLHTMRYRANAIGATLEIVRRPEGGTVVRCVLADRL